MNHYSLCTEHNIPDQLFLHQVPWDYTTWEWFLLIQYGIDYGHLTTNEDDAELVKPEVNV